MSEREPNIEIVHFHFVCPEGREEEARELLSQIEGVNVNPDPLPETLASVDPDAGVVIREKGIGMTGTAPDQGIFMDVLKVLSNVGIAGYSRETQVFKLNPPKNTN